MVPIALAKFERAQMRHSMGTNVGTKQNAHMKWALLLAWLTRVLVARARFELTTFGL